ncbi:hypothetical protein [Mesorhizobium sp. SP-1A]|uniref:hypothetical protein n=1 Tax=Mesorhizobium sp. SP-1A TaxID=3077840 RepID=UPI0028F73E3B|nr:hypothetical protein [Mesorhizobium sp. SP-1A]
MRARQATVGDLETVFHDLSKRMSDEYAAAGKDSKFAYDNLMMNLGEGRAHVLLQDDRPVAIIAWHEEDDAADTLFAAQDDFFSASTVRFCKGHIRRIQALTGNLPIRSRSWIDHPDVGRWFQIIGYVEQERQNGARLFVLPPL